ncbi:dirigent protein 1 [Brachypodium distachyon]|uniref:Dirigent protein n=1 Tax=Brachypodium distachyon TaxID=15368 RepID=I1IMK4_BRADI|nr:dirigent protein 1 [Brachypodium distachyon]KQJ88957.1 hypothetical protein BRADI_4g22270v3 [Brachypodium distachyon]|eukprot:XP_003577711.1 dirigent protein 1 [Brachypodium distachyon]
MASLPSLLLASAVLLAGATFLTHHSNTTTKLNPQPITTTHLHFYMHDDYTGPHPTAMRVVSGRSLLPNSTKSPITGRHFGDIVALNNALTEGPDNSGGKRVGTAQGFAVRVAEGGVVSDLSMHLAMEAGEFKGSSVAVKGRIDMDLEVRESVVVGGTGKFRLARGYMLSRDYDYTLADGGVIEIDLYLQHHD